MKKLSLLIGCFLALAGFSQTNIICTNSTAEDIMLGNYNPSDYAATTVIDDHDDIIQGIDAEINPDSLKAYIIKMATFDTRNTGADTVSQTTGIGAARRWAFSKFEQFSTDNDNRLQPSYLQFDQNICAQAQHRNIFAVLPGTDVADNKVIIIEGHFDSRCQGTCDTACVAQGIEDNASGSALVMELARVMSKYTFKNTFVFMLTIGEEQGLYGANAFSQFAVDTQMDIEAVLNNDVIGGVICGETSSGPSCPGLNDVDSTQVRFFSRGGFDSPNKQLSRYIKLQYKEELQGIVDVPMLITIMTSEDRVGRGGDHIPFRQDGFSAMRFTSANEHGDASNGTGYTDRQHTHNDILGVDTSGNMIIDSFFVDFNYLARNAVINGVSGAMIAIGPLQPDFNVISNNVSGPEIEVHITDQTQYATYRVALRTAENDWDTVYTMNGIVATIQLPIETEYIISVASVDSDNIESLFSHEVILDFTELGIIKQEHSKQAFRLLQNKPNPFDESTTITVKSMNHIDYKLAFIVIKDVQGKEVERLPIDLDGEMNEVIYQHGYGKAGVFLYSLEVDGDELATKRMIFAN
ncbi:MAG: Zn-dependent M28 family amino/carboxypeptidase [Arenicella sp.]|jgi:Zn-dependent M28 family amino/carboxypeptidase